MKQYIILVIGFLLTNFTKAQQACRGYEEPKPCTIERLREQTNATPFIFEGEIISLTIYNADATGKALPSKSKIQHVFYSQKNNITKIFKGEKQLKLGTIEVLEKIETFQLSNDSLDYEVIWQGKYPASSGGGVFFKTFSENNYNSGFLFDNTIKLDNSFTDSDCHPGIAFNTYGSSYCIGCIAFDMNSRQFFSTGDLYSYLYNDLQLKGAKKYIKKRKRRINFKKKH